MTTATRSRDHLALLRAVADPANDGEDTPRLALADFLDENPGERADVPCPLLEAERAIARGKPFTHFDNCSSCSGTGTVRVSEGEDRAELIRVQIELRNTEDPECLHCWPGNWCRFHELRRRESDLLARWPAWSDWPCPECKGEGNYLHRPGPQQQMIGCSTCGGSGDLLTQVVPGFTASDLRHLPVTWEVGHLFPRTLTVATLGELVGEAGEDCKTCSAHRRRGRASDLLDCLICRNTGSVQRWQPSPRLRAFASPDRWGVPVGAVMAADRVACDTGTGKSPFRDTPDCFGWRGANNPTLPQPLFDLMDGGKTSPQWEQWKFYSTLAAANLALGRALVQFGRTS